jgi:hypothetical protein
MSETTPAVAVTPPAVVVVTPQDRLTKFVGKNWKTGAGALLMIGAAVAQAQRWITPELATELHSIGLGLMGFGIGHKLERFIQLIQAQNVANALSNSAASGGVVTSATDAQE